MATCLTLASSGRLSADAGSLPSPPSRKAQARSRAWAFFLMYNVNLKLTAIHRSVKNDAMMLRLIEAMVEGLAGVDVVLLEWYPRIPGIYTFRPRYRVEHAELWKDIGYILQDRCGDCKDLVAWRLAELWRMGVDAKAEAILERHANKLQFHVFIRYGTGAVEDPSRELGMP